MDVLMRTKAYQLHQLGCPMAKASAFVDWCERELASQENSHRWMERQKETVTAIQRNRTLHFMRTVSISQRSSVSRDLQGMPDLNREDWLKLVLANEEHLKAVGIRKEQMIEFIHKSSMLAQKRGLDSHRSSLRTPRSTSYISVDLSSQEFEVSTQR